jgi:cell division protein FtsI/penicillin-binding protein 2
MSLRRWIGLGALLGGVLAAAPWLSGRLGNAPELAKKLPQALRISSAQKSKDADLRGLDLTRLDVRPGRVTAPLPGGRTAELTLNPTVQRTTERLLRKYQAPEAAVVAIAPATGDVLAYASHKGDGTSADLNVQALAPAASVFKIVTSAALVEKAGLSRETEQCYRGGKSKITRDELKEDKARDKWCANLGIALGRSLNVVFGRLAQKHLTPEDLTEYAGALGFGSEVPFPVANQAPLINVPEQPVEFARTAAGFWNTSLSPLAAAVMTQTVANHGITLKPRIVSKVLQGKEVEWTMPEEPVVLRRALKKETADELTKMMLMTVSDGSAYKVFHDTRGRSFLPGIEVAGKTGTLSQEKENRHYTWLVAFAPANNPEIAVAALVVNTPEWQIKGPHLARDVLRAFFAEKGRSGVSAP